MRSIVKSLHGWPAEMSTEPHLRLNTRADDRPHGYDIVDQDDRDIDRALIAVDEHGLSVAGSDFRAVI